MAQREGKHPVDAFLDLAISDDLQTGFGEAIFVTGPSASNEFKETMWKLASEPYCIPGISDGGAHTKFLTDGTYPTDFLIDYVKDQAVLSLEEAHWHLSTLPAMAAGFRDRGYLREGMPADIVIYDFHELALLPRYQAYDYPAGEWRLARKATGYRWILVNGVLTFADGECTGATPGVLLRHGSAQNVLTAG